MAAKLRALAVDTLTEDQAKNELAALAAEIAEHDKAYYQKDAPVISDAANSSWSSLRDDSITLAPAAAYEAAIARPIPFEAPVTSATFPSSEICMGAHRIPVGLGCCTPRQPICVAAQNGRIVRRTSRRPDVHLTDVG